jgi:D-sedoheptulose 7-phosphate isomerase
MAVLSEGAQRSTIIFQDCFEGHRALLAGVELACAEPLAILAERCVKALQGGGKLLYFGNGGSAADAQHLAAELTIRFVRNRRALAAISLTTDTSALTACANDQGFEFVFARQIEALGRPGDVAIGISPSGDSPNVIRALKQAAAMGMTAAALTGNNGGKLKGIADPLLIVPSIITARIQEMHILLGHVLCAEIEDRLGLA